MPQLTTSLYLKTFIAYVIIYLTKFLDYTSLSNSWESIRNRNFGATELCVLAWTLNLLRDHLKINDLRHVIGDWLSGVTDLWMGS